MAGQLCVFLCVVITIQWCSAQIRPFGQFSGIGGFNPLTPTYPGMNPMMGNQQQNSATYNYVNCGASDQNQNDLKVTFSRPQSAQGRMMQQRFPWLQPTQQSSEGEPVQMDFSIKSNGQQLSGNMQLVMTENGVASPGMCNTGVLGNIRQGFNRNQFNGFNNPWNPSFSPSNNQPAGQLGSGFYLQPGQSFQISRTVEIDFEEMAGSGIALCRAINGNQCYSMLSLCCTLAKGSSPLASMPTNNQFGQDPFGQGNGQGGQGFNSGTGFNTGIGFNTGTAAATDPFANTQPAAGGTTGMVFP